MFGMLQYTQYLFHAIQYYRYLSLYYDPPGSGDVYKHGVRTSIIKDHAKMQGRGMMGHSIQ